MASKALTIKKAINTRLKGDYVKLASEVEDMPKVTTGLLSFDEQTNGGLPMGFPISFQGRKSVGKSAFTYMMGGRAVDQYGGEVLLLQSEKGFDTEWAKQCGLPIKDTIYFEGDDLRSSLQLILNVLQIDKPICVILDSLSMLSGNPTGSLVDSKSRGERAVPINEFFRKLVHAMDREHPPLFMYIEHLHPVMDRPGLMTTGGETKGYANGMEIRLTIDSYVGTEFQSYTDATKKVELPVQSKVAWEIRKSKSCPFKGQGTYQLGLRETPFCKPGEINDYDELVVRGILNGHIQKAGSWFSIVETNEKYQGLEKLKAAVGTSTLREIVLRPRPEGGEEHSPVKKLPTKATKRGRGAKGGLPRGTVADGTQVNGEGEPETAEGVAGEDQAGGSE